MPRIAFCEFQDAGCDDPRCKVSFCVLQKEYDGNLAALEAGEVERIRKKAEIIAKGVLKSRGVRKPTWEQIRDLARKPQLFALAKKQLAEEDALLGRPNSN
jgi:hypothetical protein